MVTTGRTKCRKVNLHTRACISTLGRKLRSRSVLTVLSGRSVGMARMRCVIR